MFWLRLLIGCFVHELVRLYVHIILVVIEPLLIIMRVLIIKASMRPLIDNTDEYHWSTARAFSVVASALGVNSLVPFLKAMVEHRGEARNLF
jgi:splicing factor 3B subunit 1